MAEVNLLVDGHANAQVFQVSDDGQISNWLYLLRGTRVIIEMSKVPLFDSEFGPMFSVGARRYVLRDAQTESFTPLRELQKHIKNILGVDISESGSGHGDEAAMARYAVYEMAIKELGKYWRIPSYKWRLKLVKWTPSSKIIENFQYTSAFCRSYKS